MPRTARIDIPNLLHHVMVRGIEKRDIFTSDKDRLDFITRFSRLLEKTGTDCLAWALLPNHFHIFLRINDVLLSKFMRSLLTGYAVSFNLRHNRSGHLFQNRYKSIVCSEEQYLLELVRYIHLNPLRVGSVSTLDELDGYRWCGHSVILGRNELAGQTTTEVLSRFGGTIGIARRRYQAFVLDGLNMGRRDELVGNCKLQGNRAFDNEVRDPRVLGNGDFVEEILRRTEGKCHGGKVSIDRIIESVAATLGVTETELTSRTRTLPVANARSIICHLAYLSGHHGVDIARRLNLTGPGVTVAARRGREIIRNYPTLIGLNIGD